jgi:hypothetical protein
MSRRGVKGGSQWGKKTEASSSQGQVNKTRVAWMAGSRFKHLYSDIEEKVATKIEDAMRIQRKNTTEEVIMGEVKEWVDDPYYTKTQETKYFKLAETC